SRAAAETIIGMIGDGAFDDSTSITIGHEVRHFASLRDAAAEAGMSRIYAGIHFPVGNLGGQSLGECIGTRVAERMPAVPE
ncbi:MAG: phosphatidic acid phosphatase, partial [Actinomycetota bacterium]|nr:phosphatidic acid phosphatase [Actinomycetota bacterium]